MQASRSSLNYCLGLSMPCALHQTWRPCCSTSAKTLRSQRRAFKTHRALPAASPCRAQSSRIDDSDRQCRSDGDPDYCYKLKRRELLLGSTAACIASLSARALAEGGPRVTEKVFLDLTLDGRAVGRVVVGLFGDNVPKTSMNFSALATGEKGYGYKGSTFHRIVKNFVLQGGDFERGNGTGGRSIYGRTFEDENFDVLPHFPFCLSMANAGPNTNGSQFFVTVADTPWLNGKHTVFGKIVEGKELIDQLQYTPVGFSGKPKQKLVIANCGILK